MKERQQSSSTYALEFLLVSSTDHITPVTGITPTVTISKNSGSFGAASGTVSEIGNGWYKVSGGGLATDTNTVGPLILHATGTGADPTDATYTIVPWNPFDIIDEFLDSTNTVETGETIRQTLRLLRSVIVGVSSESSGTIVFKRKDGTTTALTVVHDSTGSRSSSTVGTV